MPATPEAAALTDAHRRRLILLRDTTAAVVVRMLDQVDLDGDVDGQIDRWLASSTSLVGSAQADAAGVSARYVAAYVAASGLEPRRLSVDVARFRGMPVFGRRLEMALASAPAAMLWRLGRSDGRTQALAAGLSEATRVCRSAVMAAGRAGQSEAMVQDGRVSGWRRVTSTDPCGGCMGAADGRVLRTEAGMEIHDACRCTAEAVLDGVDDGRFRRPTGQEMFDRLDSDGQGRLFAGRGGAEKAEVVRREGVGVLVDRRAGRLTEAPLAEVA